MRPLATPLDLLEQLGDADALSRRGSHHRDAELALELRRVDRDAVPLRLVHQVEADHHAVGDLEHLQREVEVALEPRGVDHHDA